MKGMKKPRSGTPHNVSTGAGKEAGKSSQTRYPKNGQQMGSAFDTEKLGVKWVGGKGGAQYPNKAPNSLSTHSVKCNKVKTNSGSKTKSSYPGRKPMLPSEHEL